VHNACRHILSEDSTLSTKEYIISSLGEATAVLPSIKETLLLS
jgi:hypothetical protein